MIYISSTPVKPDTHDVIMIFFGSFVASFCSLGIYRCLGVFNEGIQHEYHVTYYGTSVVSAVFTGSMSLGGTIAFLLHIFLLWCIEVACSNAYLNGCDCKSKMKLQKITLANI